MKYVRTAYKPSQIALLGTEDTGPPERSLFLVVGNIVAGICATVMGVKAAAVILTFARAPTRL
jgi:hypothetical protein